MSAKTESLQPTCLPHKFSADHDKEILPQSLELFDQTMLADFFDQSQLFMLAGFVLLGWVLSRRTIQRRKKVNKETREANFAMRKLVSQKMPAVPLCDAPVETQRWQVAMFDLQRELKAELDTRISIVQSLVTLADQRIATLSKLEQGTDLMPQTTGDGIGTNSNFDESLEVLVARLSAAGLTAAEIASKSGKAIGDIELTLAAMSRS